MGLFSGSPSSSVCTSCHKMIVFSDLAGQCPYCDAKYGRILGSAKSLLSKKCGHCERKIKYINCPFCNAQIDIKPKLKEANSLVCHVITRRQLANEYLEKARAGSKERENDNSPEAQFVDEKIFQYIKHLFHKFDLRNEKEAVEIMIEVHKRKILQIDLLNRLADFNFKKAQGDIEIEKARLFQSAIPVFEKLPPVLQAYVIISLFGKENPNPDGMNYDEELRDFVRKQKGEEWRKSKIENDHMEDKYKRNRDYEI